MDGDPKPETPAGSIRKVDLHGAAVDAAEAALALPDRVHVQGGGQIDYHKEHGASQKYPKKPFSLLLHGDLNGAARAAAEAITDAAANPVPDSAAAFAPVPYPTDRLSASKADRKTFLTKTFKF